MHGALKCYSLVTMYYFKDENTFFAGDSIAQIIRKLPKKPLFNLSYLHSYLVYGPYHRHPNTKETLFKNIYHIPFGYKLSQHGTLEQVLQLDANNHCNINLQQALTQFRQLSIEATTENLVGSKNVALELSGGLDSSCVAALLRQCLPQQSLHAFTNGVPLSIPSDCPEALRKSLYDESAFSALVSKHLNLQHIIVNKGYHFADIIEKYTETLGTFSESLFPLFNHPSFEIAQQMGIDTLFSGFGGDQMVSQQANRTLTELKNKKLFWKYYYEAIRKGRIQQKLKSILSNINQPSLLAMPQDHLAFIKNLPDLTHQTQIYNTTQDYAKAFFTGDLSTHLDRRITESKIIAKYYGIKQVFPLTNYRLLEFFQNLPSTVKFRHGTGRYLFRKLMQEYLPGKIYKRKDKAGGTVPAGTFSFHQQVPTLFLETISPHSNNLLADYIDLPKLIEFVEHHTIHSSGLRSLLVSILMFNHLDLWLTSLFPTKHSNRHNSQVASSPVDV